MPTGFRTIGKFANIFRCGLILILLLMAAGPAAATIAYVQGAGLNPNTGSSVSVTFSAAQTAGNFNVVVVAWDDTTSTVISITDTEGNSYVQAGTSTTISGTVTQQVYYATNIAAATAGTNKVTVVYSKSVTYPEVKIAEYSGISTTSPFDGMSSGTGTGTAIITGSLTTTNANDLLLAGDVIYGTSTGGDPNYTSRDTVGGDLEQDRIVSAVGTYTASDTQTPSSWWLIQLVAFKAASGTVPAAPTSLTNTVVSSSAINLTWTASTGATGYVIQRCAGASCTSFAQVGTSTAASYSDTGLTAGTSYSYRVDATNTAGASGFSNTTTGTTTAAVPAAPTSLTNTVVSSTQINLTWTASTGATGYVIQRCAGTSCTSFAQVGTSTTASYSNTGLTASTSYSYRVDATNTAGTSGFSNTTTGTTSAAATAPTTPGTLSAASASSTQINLTWGASTDTVGVTGYLISQCSGAGCSTFTQIASVAGTATSYSNTGLTAGTSYSYEVRATDAAGLFSGYSNVATAMTPTGSGVSGSVSYGYDALGRLIQVAAPTVNSVQAMAYDAAGNITSTAATPIATESIQAFSVSQASPGEQITIDGSGFSTTASSNTVTINGVAATVVSATATQLVVTVPSGASTGTVKVTVAGATVTSTQSLKVTAATVAPTITSFSPAGGPSGTSVTISGTNFSTVAANDKVLINGTAVQVMTATATSLTMTVPVDVSSGLIQVVTSSGVATSATNFIVPPSGVPLSSIAATGTATENGSRLSLAISSSGQYVTGLFSGTEGDLYVRAIVTGDATGAVVLDPTGAILGTISTIPGYVDLPELPRTGTYSVVATGGSISGSVYVSVAKAQLEPLDLTWNAINVTAGSLFGQRSAFTFSGTQNEIIQLVQSSEYNGQGTPALSLVDANGALIWSGTAAATVTLDPLPVTGSYTLFSDPGISGVNGNYDFNSGPGATLIANASPSFLGVYPNGTNSTVGRATFQATAGDALTVYVTPYQGINPSTGNIELYEGSTSNWLGSFAWGPPFALYLVSAPVTGTYFVQVSGQGPYSVQLLSAPGGTNALDANAVTYTIPNPGELSVLSFAASTSGFAEMNLDLSSTGATALVGPGPLGPVVPLNVFLNAGNNTVALAGLQAGGTYYLYFAPQWEVIGGFANGHYGINTGTLGTNTNVTATVSSELIEPLAGSGSFSAVSTRLGQNIRFTTTSSYFYTARTLTVNNTSGCAAAVVLWGPSGSSQTIAYDALTGSSTNSSGVYIAPSGATTIHYISQAAQGTYTLEFMPAPGCALNFGANIG